MKSNKSEENIFLLNLFYSLYLNLDYMLERMLRTFFDVFTFFCDIVKFIYEIQHKFFIKMSLWQKKGKLRPSSALFSATGNFTHSAVCNWLDFKCILSTKKTNSEIKVTFYNKTFSWNKSYFGQLQWDYRPEQIFINIWKVHCTLLFVIHISWMWNNFHNCQL